MRDKHQPETDFIAKIVEVENTEVIYFGFE